MDIPITKGDSNVTFMTLICIDVSNLYHFGDEQKRNKIIIYKEKR